MDYTSKTRSLQSLVKDMNKGIINLSHKLQRPEGQWNRKQRTDLIDSLLRHYPINPTYAIVEDDGILSIIDNLYGIFYHATNEKGRQNVSSLLFL